MTSYPIKAFGEFGFSKISDNDLLKNSLKTRSLAMLFEEIAVLSDLKRLWRNLM